MAFGVSDSAPDSDPQADFDISSLLGRRDAPATDRLHLLDAHAVADLAQFVARARRLDDQAAVWLSAHERALVATASPLFGAGLTDAAPTLLGVKVLPLAQPARLQYVVQAQALSDRLVRMGREADTTLRTPPVEVHEVWAAVTPPRTGWQRVAEVSVEQVRAAARAGIDEIAKGVPEVAGELAVHELRGRVWGRAADALAGLTQGLAFTLDAFGFLPSQPSISAQPARHSQSHTVHLFQNGMWQRAAAPFGDAIVRLPSSL
ncbi:hypothetical protein [Pseudoclavibacter sp. 13-3]|uniref:hypothetical protein n=1 Tax=Pseudoclavibacter sp. 13-3 TaxID=2901228 RepID=UPI001E4237D9|nr:hypothetical protein [Pseudoclavibacter sp. 13-3]MCD7100826.1 hypothetical protein [Pseudoclavibacter sp. 13-3]